MAHILLIDDKVPDPVFGAGFPRAFRLLLSLVELGHKVSFFPTNRQSVENLDRDALRSHNVWVVDDIKGVQDLNAAIISRPHNVHYHMPLVRKHHPECKIVYDTEALWYRRYDLQMEITGRLPWWAYRYDELGMARACDLCYVVNSEEKQILEANGVARVRVLGHALDIHERGSSFEDRKHCLVVGGILEQDSSNEDALWWYLEQAWEKVHGMIGVDLNVTGHRHTERLLKNPYAGVKLMGLVDDLTPLYESHRVFVAATRFATGIPWKVHESMAHGCPCVISSLLAKQLGVTDGNEAMVASSPDEFVEKTIALHEDKELWKRVRSGGYDVIHRDCKIDRFRSIIQASLDELLQ